MDFSQQASKTQSNRDQDEDIKCIQHVASIRLFCQPLGKMPVNNYVVAVEQRLSNDTFNDNEMVQRLPHRLLVGTCYLIQQHLHTLRSDVVTKIYKEVLYRVHSLLNYGKVLQNVLQTLRH